LCDFRTTYVIHGPAGKSIIERIRHFRPARGIVVKLRRHGGGSEEAKGQHQAEDGAFP
jgi:hypothetical protein